MSGHRWNNRFNPPLETASVRFPRAPIEPPQIPANHTTHQMPGAPTPILYTNQITYIPNLSLSFVTSNATELTVTLNVSFAYRMKGTDHYEFTFTNSNTGISTIKRYQQSGNVYTIGEFDPGTKYSVYVTPVINGQFTASSATTSFLSSPATAPGILQGAVLTGSGSYAVIKFAGVYPSEPFPNQIAVNDNFGDAQLLVNVTSALKTIVIGPYTDGSSYQFQITPVTVLGGIYRYGTPTGIPTNYFIPGPPGTPQVTAIRASNTTVTFSVCADTAFHPFPDYYQIVMCRSTLTPLTTISGQITDLSTTYPGFSISGLSPSLFYTLSAGVGSCNLVADITNDAGIWYSFRVTNISVSGGNTYFTNPYTSKTSLSGTSFTVNFNTLAVTSVISTVSALSTVSSSVVVGGVTTSFNPSGAIFTVSPVQTTDYTTFVTQTFANNVFSLGSDYGTIFAGPPFEPGYGAGPDIGNQTFRWTVERAYGPRPLYYTFYGTNISTISTTTLTGTVSGLRNGDNYTLYVTGFANNVTGPPTSKENITPAFARPTSLAVTRITGNTVTLSIGRPLGGSEFGYVITASGTGGGDSFFADSGTPYISASITGLQSVSYQFIAYTQTSITLSRNNLSAAAPGTYYLGPPFQPSNVKGIYYGYPSNGLTRVNLTLTASRGLVSGTGPFVAQYNISDNFGNLYTAPALPNYDLQYTFTSLSAYISYTFTITPFGNNVSGTPVTSSTFDFNPQPPTSPNLFMTGSNGGTMNITFTGPTLPASTTDYYTISALQTPFVGGATRFDVPGSPVSYPSEGFPYKFAIYKTICGVTSSTFVQTPQVTGGPPVTPFVGYTLGRSSITFSLSVSTNSAVVISNFRITEYYKDILTGNFQPTGGVYTIPANTPGLSPSATRTISGLFSASYSLAAAAGTWTEAVQTSPQFSFTPDGFILDNSLAINAYTNLVTLKLIQSTSSLVFPVTSFVDGPSTKKTYGTILTTKPTALFNPAQSLQFTWCSGVGPFTGGTYRYDAQSLGGDTLISPSASVIINLYVGAPGTPSVVTNNVSAVVTFTSPPSTTVPPQYYEVTDNYGRTISGTTTASAYVFGSCVTGSAYSFFVTAYAQGISSAPSQLSTVVYPGRPSPPSLVPSFGYNNTQKAYATLSTALSLLPYIPVTDVFLSTSGVASYTTTKTNTQSQYTNTTGGPTYTLANLSLGTSYTFTICAYTNQVYSTLSSYNYYVGSLTPNGQPTIVLSNTTAYVSVSAANTASKLGGVNPDTYVFSFSGATTTGSVTIPYNTISSTYTGVLTGLTALSDYTFSGYTITNGISYGGGWSDLRTFNAGGPRPPVAPYVSYSILGNPLTRTVSLQVVIFTGCAGVTGLWADTSYYISVSSQPRPVNILVTFDNPVALVGQQTDFRTISSGNVDVIVAGGGGGGGSAYIPPEGPGGGGGGGATIGQQPQAGFFGSAGGLVKYTYTNVSADSIVSYQVGYGGGTAKVGEEGGGLGGNVSYVEVSNFRITAGGGAGGGQPHGQNGFPGEDPYGGNSGGVAYGGPSGDVTFGGGSAGGAGGTYGLNSSNVLVAFDPSVGQNGYVTISCAGYRSTTVMTVSSFVVNVQTGNTYYANIYAIKNQVIGNLFPESGFVVPPAPPLNPTITLTATPSITVLDLRGISEQVVYVTYPQGSQPNSPFKTTKAGNYTVTVAGGGGGTGGGPAGGAGGLVTYTFSNISSGTYIYYIVGGGGGGQGVGLGLGAGGGGAGSAVSINDLLVFAGGGGGGMGDGGGWPNGGGYGGYPWGSSTDPNLLSNLGGTDGNTIGGHGGGNNFNQVGGGIGGTATTAATSGSGDGPSGSVVTTGGGSPAGQSGFVRIIYTPTPSPVPATIAWGQSATSDVSYYYSVNGGTYISNGSLTTGQISLDYGSTSKIRVYSLINGVSSAAITSPSAYVFTNPPTTLRYGRTLTSVTLSWGSAFQPAYPSNITYTLSVTGTSTVSGLSIGGSGGPKITIGSNIMNSAVYSQFVTALNIANQRPIVITLSGIGVTYNASFTVTSIGGITIQSAIGAYSFGGSGSSLTSLSDGKSIAFSITNPPSLPTDGYTLSDLCSGVVIASNIYQNTYTWTGATLGSTYNIAVQALNSNLYSGRSNAITGIFTLATVPVSTLSATYTGGNVTLSWKTPQQYDGITPTTTPPYTWTIVDQSGNVTRTSAQSTASTQSVTGINPGLGGKYTYSIVANYYGISSSSTAANQISLTTTAPPSVTQATTGPIIIVTWQTASQSVYLPENPTVLTSIPPNGGYSIVDLCGRYTATLSAAPTDTQIYVQIAEANLYNYYNFAVSASHNGIMSAYTAPGAIFLGVKPVTSPAVSVNGMIATLTWNAPLSNGPNAPYRIFDSNGYTLGNKANLAVRTETFSSPGVYSVTTLATEGVLARASGAGGSVAAGGFISNTYAVTPGTTIVVKVGAAGAGGGNSTVYVPNPGNPYLILDAGGGGGYTVSGDGFVRNGVPDGGGIQLPGSGSAGGGAQPIVGGGSPPGTDGRVQLTLTTASLASSIYTSAISISFTIANYTTYNLQIESSSNGLTAVASIALNTTVAAPTGLNTSFRGFILSNAWTPAPGVPEYFITNLTTGDYNSNILSSPSPFSVPGIINTTYRFSIYSVNGGIPSSEITSSSNVTLFCPQPSNFKANNSGGTITFSASGNTSNDFQTFTLTNGSGTILQSNILNYTGSISPPIAPIFGNTPGQIYTFNLYGVLSGLCSEPAPVVISLLIPGSTNLGLDPELLTGDSANFYGDGYFEVPANTPFTAVVTGTGGPGGVWPGQVFAPGGVGGKAIATFAGSNQIMRVSVSVNINPAGGGSYSSIRYQNTTATNIVTTVMAGGGGGGGYPFGGGPNPDFPNYGYDGGGYLSNRTDGPTQPYLGGQGGGPVDRNYGYAGAPGAAGYSGLAPTSYTSTGFGGGAFGGAVGFPGVAGSVQITTNYVTQYKLKLYQCVPPADSFRVVSTNLAGVIYSNNPTTNWVGVAIGASGNVVVAANSLTNGSNIYFSTNGGTTWASQFTAGLVGATATGITLAGNGTWGALLTATSGLWVTSNVVGSPWFQVGNTLTSNISSAGFSPDGSKLVVGQGYGYVYSIPTSQLTLPSPAFTSGQGVPQTGWKSIAWSGDGTMVFAAGNGNPIYSTTGGTFWTQMENNSVFYSISPNSNGTYVLIGGNGYPTALRRDPTNYNWQSVFPGNPVGLPNVSGGSYLCACSYTGDIQTALVQGTATPSAYISYNFGRSWLPETRFSATAFTGSAIPSNGFNITVVGSNSKLQSLQYVATTTPTTTTISISTTAASTSGFVTVGSTGYQITPYFKNIPGPSVFAFDTPSPGPPVFPQTSGPVSFSSPYTSGYGTQGGFLRGYFIVDSTATFDAAGVTFISVPADYNTLPTITSYTTGVASSQRGFVISAGDVDILPGTYVASIGSNAAAQKTSAALTALLRAPTITSLGGQDDGKKIKVTWSAPTLAGSSTTSTFNIISNGTVVASNLTGTSQQIPNSGTTPTTIAVQRVFGAILSPSSTSSNVTPPLPPTGLLVTGYAAASSSINLSWNIVSGNSYTISYAGTTIPNINEVPYIFPLLPGSNIIIGVAAFSNNLLSTYSVVSVTNRIDGFIAPGLTVTRSIPSQFIITAMSIIGGGGGGGGGGYALGGNTNGRQGGGGGAQGGTLLFTGGTGPVQQSSSITLVPGKAGTGGLYGGGSIGGQVSYIQITSNSVQTIAWAGGGGGGGGGNGGSGAAGGRLTTNESYGNGGTGGGAGNINGGGGGTGGWGSSFATNPNITPVPLGNYVVTPGSNGDIRQGIYPNATTGGKGGGPGGGAAQPTSDTPGNNATGFGNGGGGGAPSSSGSSGSTTAPRGGAGSDGYISISYCYLTS